MGNDEWLTIGQACAMRGVSAAVVRGWCQTGAVEAKKRSGAWLILASSLSQPCDPKEEDSPLDYKGEYAWTESFRPKLEWHVPEKNEDGAGK